MTTVIDERENRDDDVVWTLEVASSSFGASDDEGKDSEDDEGST